MPDDIERAWAEELERRAAKVMDGRGQGREAMQVIAEIRSELTASKR